MTSAAQPEYSFSEYSSGGTKCSGKGHAIICLLSERRKKRTGGERTEEYGIQQCNQHGWNQQLSGKGGKIR